MPGTLLGSGSTFKEGFDMKIWETCCKCLIGKLAHRHVLWSGEFKPQIIFIGEGPGRVEDVFGKPFVGPAGKLLRLAISIAEERSENKPTMGFTNLIACRPAQDIGALNRQPSLTEIHNCRPRLIALLQKMRPKVVVFCGRLPFELGKPVLALAQVEAQIFEIPHPAAILRKGGQEAENWDWYIGRIEDALSVACG